MKADYQTLLLELLELASRVDAWNPATKSAAGLLAIGNEEVYQRVNEAFQEGRLFEEMASSLSRRFPRSPFSRHREDSV